MRGQIVKRQGKSRKDGKSHPLYYIVYQVGKRPKWEAVPPPRTKKHAEKLLAERLAQIHRGEFTEPKKVTFEEFVHIWMAKYAEGGGEIRQSTLTLYRGFFRLHLGPAFNEKQLGAITVEDVQAYKAEKLKQLSPQSVKHHLRLLRQMFRHAIDWGYLRTNVAEKVRNPKIPKREMDCLMPEEFQAFLEHVPEEWEVFFLVTVCGGLRMGEALAMKWGNLNRRTGQYFVRETWLRGREGRSASLGPPKSESSIAPVDLPPEVFDALDEHHRRQKAMKLGAGSDYQDHDLIFATPVGGLLDDSHVKQRVFFPALEAAGLRAIRFHDLRHTCATVLITEGESPKYVQKQMRHASIEMTFNTYGHLYPDSNREAAARFGRALLGKKSMTKMGSA